MSFERKLRTGILLSRSSSSSSSFICRSRTPRYSQSEKSCTISCQGRKCSWRSATFILRVGHASMGFFSRGFRGHALASHEGDYPGEVSYCSTTLIPHLEEEVGGKCMDLVEIEEERLEDGRSRICKVTHYQDIFANRIDEENMHPGAKTPQYSDRSSTTSFDARARGHCRCGGREFCSCTTFEK